MKFIFKPKDTRAKFHKESKLPRKMKQSKQEEFYFRKETRKDN
jgi:hypothetical protein